MASILREIDSTLLPKFQTSSPAKSKATSALRAKQEMRKFRGTSSPDPSLEIDMDEFTSFTQHLRSSTRVLALVGAGLSVASGLSTFRGDDRRWRGIEPQELSNVEALSQDPAKVWWFFSDRMKRAQEAKPNRGHVALAKLAKEKDGFFAVNQNIDGKQTPQGYGLGQCPLTLLGLCQRAGFPNKQIAQVHGTLFEMKCSKHASDSTDRCDYSTPVSYPATEALTITHDISDTSVPLPPLDHTQLPHCPRCDNLMRPSVVLFGESLPSNLTGAIHSFISSAPLDLLLVIGTSGVVLPAAMYIPKARNAGARVAYFNMEEYYDEPGCVWTGDWMFKGDAATMVPELLKGIVGNVVSV
jgi:NAD-dependent deacetylase sirtuin 5